MNIEERTFTVVWGILSFSYHKLKLPIHYLKLISPFTDTDKANLLFIMSEWLFSTLAEVAHEECTLLLYMTKEVAVINTTKSSSI